MSDDETPELEVQETQKRKGIGILKSILKLVLPAVGISTGLYFMFYINPIPIFVFLISIQILANLVWDWINKKKYEIREVNRILEDYVNTLEDARKEYESLEYKKYILPLVCRQCGRENNVEMDLANTEFECKNCGRKNAIYINFSVATITDPINVNDFITKAYNE